MMNISLKAAGILDRLIFFFMLIFLLSLTNSIFFNQLGYFGALLLLIFRAASIKEFPFSKTGLESAFIWFILAEILSAFFSDYQSAAINNTLKRALLIPIVYVTIASINDIKKGKLFFKIYIGASLVTILIYIYFAYQHYLRNLYSLTESGPSIFQYPITASEIISFAVIFLFAFLLNEKTSLKNKILLFVGFGLSFAALISTYKRTGWLGALAGIFVILLIKKQWKIIIPAAAAVFILFLMQEDVSRINIYKYINGKAAKEYAISTGGKVHSINKQDKFLFVSDFENGLLKFSGSDLIKKYEFDAPVTKFMSWKDNYYLACLIDSRIILLKEKTDSLVSTATLLTEGFTSSIITVNNFLYVLDSDSGLTVFKDPSEPANYLRIKKLAGFNQLFADKNFIIVFSSPKKIKIFKLELNLPGKEIAEYNHSRNIISINLIDGNLFISDDSATYLFSLKDSSVNKLSENNSLSQIYQWEESEGHLFAASLNGIIYELEYPVKNSLKILSENNLEFAPISIEYSNNKLYAAQMTRSRFNSIWDPYHPSNTVRFALWRAGWEMFKDHPLFGVGDIDLREYYMKYKRDFDKEIQGHMHNNFIHILVTLGLVGLLAVIYLFIKILIIDFKIYSQLKNEPFLSSYALGTIGAFFSFLISGLTELNFGDHEIITLVWFISGLNIAFYFNFKKQNPN